jgi:transposase
MYIERVPNRNSPPAVLLRESYREGSKIRKRTLANLSKLPDTVVDNLKIVLKGGAAIENLSNSFSVERSLPHGHVAAVLGTIKKLDLHNLIAPNNSTKRALVLAMLVARILDPRSKLATARELNSDETCFSSLSELLGLEKADEDDLYSAIDWLAEKQELIENELANRHLTEGSLVLYDVSSTYFEGTQCHEARSGYNRDKKKGFLQIVFGLLCNKRGCPIAVEVFEGNTAALSDSTTITTQIEKVRQRFGIEQVVWVGDRGMITNARILADFKQVEGLDWITALRASQIRKLFKQEAIQLSLLDETDLVEFSGSDYPDERLIACRNPFLASEKAVTREALLQGTEQELDKIVAATRRNKRALKGADQIGLRVGRVINCKGVGKYFNITINDESFSYSRKEAVIAEESALDGVYIIRTSVKAETLNATQTVRAYKSLSQVEQAFRSYKTVDLKVRPIYHRLEQRVKAHIFLCMLSYYVEWHMRKALAPLLFDDEKVTEQEGEIVSVVALSRWSKKARAKAATQKKSEKLPVHSFRTLMADLATIVKNKFQSQGLEASLTFEKITQPTSLQQKALDLLEVSLICTQ